MTNDRDALRTLATAASLPCPPPCPEHGTDWAGEGWDRAPCDGCYALYRWQRDRSTARADIADLLLGPKGTEPAVFVALLDALDRARALADRMLDLFPTDGEETYGAFPGGDPREFKPDEDCSTEAERTAHKAACDAWNRGDQIEIPGGCEERDVEPGTERAVADEAIRNGAAAATASPGHVRIAWQTFGLGTYVYRDETIEAARKDALAVHAALDAKAGA